MALYLWHMVPVLIVAAFYLTGLAPEPGYGSAGWWALRVPWVVVLGVVLVGVLRALRPLERGVAAVGGRVLPDAGLRGAAAWRMWVGLGVSVWALAHVAGHGFAYGGEFPVWTAVGLGVGVGLVLVGPSRRGGEGGGPDDGDRRAGAGVRRTGGGLREAA
jgi:hypothetical protein